MPYLRGEKDKPKGCIFCHKQSCTDEAEHILCRNQHCYVTLNRYPYTSGHLMVVPFEHVNSLEDLSPAALTEIMSLVNLCLSALRQAYQPHGFNIGINLGEAAGAGIAEHIHVHVVPRWNADSNFMPIIGNTRIIPEILDESFSRLLPIFEKLIQEQETD